MQSTNFEFIRPYDSALASLGGLAEAYAHSDPASSLVKLRTFAEHSVATIYEQFRLPMPFDANLFDLLDLPVEHLIAQREQKYRKMGAVTGLLSGQA